MALLHRNTAPAHAPAQHAAVPERPASIERPMADALRALLGPAPDFAQHGRAQDGRPAVLVDAATVLWTRFLKFDAADPHWPDRDRFVAAADAVPLLCALLHLTGHDGSGIAAPRRLLQAPVANGGEAWRGHPAVTPSMGPPGQALATGIGLALAERLLAARFGKSLVDHRTWVIASDADLMAGIGHESASFAGHLKLDRLAVLWGHDAAGATTATVSGADEVLKRFASYGWAVRQAAGGDLVQVAAALSFAVRSRKPTLIALASPASRSPLARGGEAGAAFLPSRERVTGWRRPVAWSDLVLARWSVAGERGSVGRRAWLKRAARHPMRGEFERVMAGRLPDGLREVFAARRLQLAARADPAAPRDAGQQILAGLMPVLPELIAGSAPAAAPDPGLSEQVGTVGPGNFRGRHICRGIGDHGMAAAMNGMALHGGVIPCADTALACSDAIRPALRLAALTERRVIHVLEQDGAGSAALHQPAGHLASLRAVPNLYVYRPADAIETAECWELALRRSEGPSLLVLTRQQAPPLRPDAARNLCARGGYVLAEADGPRRATLIASGGEVALASGARRLLAAAGIAVAVVSLPCWELFAQQDEAYRASVLGAAPRVGIEAALGFGWERWLGEDGWFAGAQDGLAGTTSLGLAEPGGLTAEAVAAALRKRLGRDRGEETTVHGQDDRH